MGRQISLGMPALRQHQVLRQGANHVQMVSNDGQQLRPYDLAAQWVSVVSSKQGLAREGRIVRRRAFATLGAVVASALAVVSSVSPPSQASSGSTLVGAWSKSWSWFDAAVGPVHIYRGYDPAFAFATWPETNSAQVHPNAEAYDYTFNLPPAAVASGQDDVQLRTFIASTPADRPFYLTNYHEPEQEIESGLFTASQFRASEAHLAGLVHEQNLLDGGQRKVSLVLMVSTFTGFKQRNPATYWPTASDCVATVSPCDMLDLVSVDAYATPHATGTTGVPTGYTDGLKWKSASALLAPAYKWAVANSTPWAISELGYLEDVNNSSRKATELTNAVSYAKTNGALFVEYWDSRGSRADWELRYANPPVPSTSASSNAALAWKSAVSAP